jgi:hypothetical protein
MSFIEVLNKFFQAVMSVLRGIGGGAQPDEPAGQPPTPVSPKVLLIVFDPAVPSQGGKKLSQAMNWYSVDDLVTRCIADLTEVSGGYLNYRIAGRVDVDGMPVKIDGFCYTADQIYNVVKNNNGIHQPDTADYTRIINDHNLTARINSGEIDEVWMFGPPYAGFYESRMVGPGSFFCNAPELTSIPGLTKRFIMMGFNYQVTVGFMLESMGHRSESIMERVFRNQSEANHLWHRFIRYEKTHPGEAECGNVHFAPNSTKDYEWGNPTMVASRCRSWAGGAPDLTAAPVQMNCAEWGNGEIRAHHKWWMLRFPRVSGSQNGIALNWWKYITNPNNVQ